MLWEALDQRNFQVLVKAVNKQDFSVPPPILSCALQYVCFLTRVYLLCIVAGRATGTTVNEGDIEDETPICRALFGGRRRWRLDHRWGPQHRAGCKRWDWKRECLACAKHAANKGNSYAYDLNCGVATLSFSAIPNGNGTFTLTVTGSGLLPGSTVNMVDVGTGIPTPLGTVASNGTFSWSNSSESCSQSPADVYVTGTAANGTNFYAPDITTPPANCT